VRPTVAWFEQNDHVARQLGAAELVTIPADREVVRLLNHRDRPVTSHDAARDLAHELAVRLGAPSYTR
jgi:hypothetical protein